MPRHPRFTVWYGEAKHLAEFVVQHTSLRQFSCEFRRIGEKGSAFAANPKLIQDILYLDKPDVIVTSGKPEKPIVGLEFSAEAPTGHDCFQRMARVAASLEYGIPFAYVFPRRRWVRRAGKARWDEYNPLVFKTLAQMSRFHGVPALGFLWPADKEHGDAEQGYLVCDKRGYCLPRADDPEIGRVWAFVNLAVEHYLANEPFSQMVFTEYYAEQEARMWEWFHARGGNQRSWSPLTSCTTFDDLNQVRREIRKYTGVWIPSFPEHIKARGQTVIYHNSSKTFRSDPYAGALIAVDYLLCRNGPTRQHRFRSLAIHFREASISQVVRKAQRYHERDCPLRAEADAANLSRYYSLHLREGCRYTKQKEIRTICAFADIIIFKDGILI